MIRKIRQELGLSQESVAGYLRISRSQLAMIEAKRRDLNATAHIQLLSLYNQLISKDKKETNISPDIEKSTGKNLQKSIEGNLTQREHLLISTTRKLKKLEEQNKQATNILANLEAVRAEGSVNDKLLLGIIKSNAQKSLKASSADIQLKIQMKIQGLIAELKFLTDRKAKLNI